MDLVSMTSPGITLKQHLLPACRLEKPWSTLDEDLVVDWALLFEVLLAFWESPRSFHLDDEFLLCSKSDVVHLECGVMAP